MIILIIVTIVIFSTACVDMKAVVESDDLDERFFTAIGYKTGAKIVVDKETNVCYYVKTSYSGSSGGGFGYMTVLLHSDGTPILWINGKME